GPVVGPARTHRAVSRLIYDQGALVDVSPLRYNGFMWVIKFAVIAAALSLMAVSSAFAQVEIEAGKATPPPPGPRINPPPLTSPPGPRTPPNPSRTSWWSPIRRSSSHSLPRTRRQRDPVASAWRAGPPRIFRWGERSARTRPAGACWGLGSPSRGTVRQR